MWLKTKVGLVVTGILLSVFVASHSFIDRQYTPPHIWSDDREAKFYEDWFGDQLQAMGEPSLWELSTSDKSARIYRMLQLPTFTPAVAARVTVQADGSARVHVTKLNGAGGYKPGRPEERKVIDLEPRQVQALEALFERTGFWRDRIGMRERTIGKRKRRCTDGTSYVVEALSVGNYKLVRRHECWMEDEILEVLQALAELSGTMQPFRIEF